MTEASTPLNGAQSGHGSGGLNATRVATTKFKAIPIPVETDSQNTWHLVVMLILCVASIFVCFASAALCYRSAKPFLVPFPPPPDFAFSRAKTRRISTHKKGIHSSLRKRLLYTFVFFLFIHHIARKKSRFVPTTTSITSIA